MKSNLFNHPVSFKIEHALQVEVHGSFVMARAIPPGIADNMQTLYQTVAALRWVTERVARRHWADGPFWNASIWTG